MKAPHAPTFADQLAPHIERIGQGSERQSNGRAAVACGVTPRTMQLWRAGEIVPNRATQTGALMLLAQAAPPPATPSRKQ